MCTYMVNSESQCPKIASTAPEILFSNLKINLCTVHLILQTLKISKKIMHVLKIFPVFAGFWYPADNICIS
jgi:hypothetical protein